MTAYYNEIDPYAAAWLRNLIAAGHIADGVVDERSIVDVRPEDLAGFTQVHFFAGIGGWSHAARLAGWPDDRPLWTGSCPCQPFSVAGKRAGTADERHLWPEMHRLVAAVRPPVVVGEQVASRAGLDWLDAVCSDLEAAGYATGAIDLCAASVGAPHIRQRLWWVAYAESERKCANELGRNRSDRVIVDRSGQRGHGGDDGAACRVAYADGRNASAEGLQRGGEYGQQPEDGRIGRGVADADGAGHQLFQREEPAGVCGQAAGAEECEQQLGADSASLRMGDSAGCPSPTNGHWRDADWLCCRDGKWRPVEPGTSPLAYGAPARVGRLRAYGNAIVPALAAEILIATATLIANRLKPVANGGTDGL
jgi:DNA (cytosine-5)-methyltransferase 1